MRITMEELDYAQQQANGQCRTRTAWRSAAEWMSLLGVSRAKMHRLLAKAVPAGFVQMSVREGRSAAGRKLSTPIYACVGVPE